VRGSNNRLFNQFQHAIQRLEYLIVPEPQDAVAALLEVRSSLTIVFLLCRVRVASAVELNDQPAFDATEVSEI